MKHGLVAFCILFPIFLLVIMFTKQSSVPNSKFPSDYSFRPNGDLSAESSEEIDPDIARVEQDLNQTEKKDLTRIPAAAEFCKTAVDLNAQNSSRYEIHLLNQRMRDRGLQLSKEAAEIFAETSPVFSAAPPVPTTPAGKFMYALRKAGMVDGVDWEEPDYETALNVLKEISNEDPDNAAPSLFQLVIEQRRGASLEDLSDLIADISSARKFDTFYSRAMRELRESAIAWQDPTSYMLSSHLLSVMPMPTYNALSSVVNQLAHSEPELKEHLAEVMTQTGRESAESFSTYAYSVLDYTFGRSFTDREIPPFTEIDQRKSQPSVPVDQMSIDTQNCSDGTYGDYLSKLATLKGELNKN